MPMHPQLQAIFDERKTPTHANARAVHDALRPILNVAALVDKQMAHYRSLHLDAKLAIHDVGLDPKQERIKQQFKVAHEATTALIAAGERLADAMTTLETSLDQDEKDVAAMLAGVLSPDHRIVDTETITITRKEYAALRAGQSPEAAPVPDIPGGTA